MVRTLPENDILLETADRFFRRPALSWLCPECPAGLGLSAGPLSEQAVSDLAFGLSGGMVEVTKEALAPQDVGEAAVTEAYQLLARHPVSETAPTRFVYRALDGEIPVSRMFNWKLRLKREFQGRGIGTIAFALQVRRTRQLGLASIRAAVGGNPSHPTLYGYSYWPRFGFGGQIPPEVWWTLPQRELGRLGIRLMDGPIDVRDLIRIPGGWQVWARHGAGFPMSFDLSDTNPYVRQLEAALWSLGL